MYPMGAQRETRERGTQHVPANNKSFEPTEACTSLVFKTRALNHSTTSPKVQYGL